MGDFFTLLLEDTTAKSPAGAAWAWASLLAKRRDLRCPYASAQATVGRFPEGAARARPLKSRRWFSSLHVDNRLHLTLSNRLRYGRVADNAIGARRKTGILFQRMLDLVLTSGC